MIITQTPLRISFVGGGTDFSDFYTRHGGAVLSSAIDKYIYVIVKERFDEKIVLNYSKKEIVDSVSEISHELIREAMKKTGVKKGIEISTISDIPSEGSGLGSSSTVTVGLLHALYLYQGTIPDQETLAQKACEIEIDILKKPIGKQDQYIASYGGLRQIEFNKDGMISSTRLNLDSSEIRLLGSHLMLFYTGITRKSEIILSNQKKAIGHNVEILKELLRQERLVKKALEKGNFAALGRALDLSWNLKKKLANGITNSEIDSMFKVAKRAGAIGGKIAGAGGGGFLLLYVPLKSQHKVRLALKAYKELPFNLEIDGSKAIFNIRRAS